MNEKEKDQQIERFFKSHKQEIPDNGFSRKVIKRLPKKEEKLSNIWIGICMIIIIILFFTSGGIEILLQTGKVIFDAFVNSISEVDPMYIIVAFLVLTGLGYYRIASTE